ncbi:LysR family transcriptional regulator [Gulosibacter bifidus]|uniref:LysR family transcriptional regulator n=1 Tax=Gulosibacter bifidus TaxID=272239 RepID=A0ABW5RJ51_9MICO|nr:LysR family transcriptional regulator [Gulosibacter bifidus]
MWDSHRLYLLCEFARHGTISAVANALHFSVSSVSQQLAKLEDEVGIPLFERQGRLLKLTPAGHTVVNHGHEVLRLEDTLRAKLDAARPEIAGTIRIATLETVANALFGDVLDRLHRAHPLLRVEAEVMQPEGAITDLEAFSVDMVIAEQYPGHTREILPGIARLPLGMDALRLAVPSGSGIESLADAHDAGFVLEPRGSATRQWVVQQCRAAGFEPDARFESANLHTHLQFVIAGHAVSILPDLMFLEPVDGVSLVDLPGMPRRELVCMVRSSAQTQPAVLAMHEALRDALRELRPDWQVAEG